MPWKLIGFVILLVIVAVFATLNLSNRVDISLGVYTFTQVPVFLALLLAFLAGVLVMVPYVLAAGRRYRRRQQLREQPRAEPPEELPPQEGLPEEAFPEEPPRAAGGARRRGGKRKAADRHGDEGNQTVER